MILMTTWADLIWDIAYLNDMTVAGRLRDERSNTWQTDNEAGFLEFAKSSARRHPRHAELLNQFGLGLQPISWLQFAAAYRVQHILLDRDISGLWGSFVNEIGRASCRERVCQYV